MNSLFGHYPKKPKSRECQNAFLILCIAHDAASSFLDSFQKVRKERNARGVATDEEQDLLRAMLVFAAAGLDSMVKELISEALPKAIEHNEGAAAMFKQFIERRLNKGEEIDHRFLADVLGDADPRRQLVKHLVDELTASSLQSTEQLLRVAAFFDIASNVIVANRKELSDIFNARNQIVHEMDIDFDPKNRNRRQRKKENMKKFTDKIFQVSLKFLYEVDKRLPT